MRKLFVLLFVASLIVVATAANAGAADADPSTTLPTVPVEWVSQSKIQGLDANAAAWGYVYKFKDSVTPEQLADLASQAQVQIEALWNTDEQTDNATPAVDGNTPAPANTADASDQAIPATDPADCPAVPDATAFRDNDGKCAWNGSAPAAPVPPQVSDNNTPTATTSSVPATSATDSPAPADETPCSYDPFWLKIEPIKVTFSGNCLMTTQMSTFDGFANFGNQSPVGSINTVILTNTDGVLSYASDVHVECDRFYQGDIKLIHQDGSEELITAVFIVPPGTDITSLPLKADEISAVIYGPACQPSADTPPPVAQTPPVIQQTPPPAKLIPPSEVVQQPPTTVIPPTLPVTGARETLFSMVPWIVFALIALWLMVTNSGRQFRVWFLSEVPAYRRW